MARFVFFIVLLAGFGLVLSMGTFQSWPVINVPFNLGAVEKSHAQQLALAEKSGGEGHGEELGEGAELEEVEEETGPKVVTIPLDTEELKNGHNVFTKIGKCTTCHGMNGEGRKSQQAPKLAGQYDWYLYNQLVNMKSKVRENKKMEPYLKNLSDKEFQDVALYLSKLPFAL